MQLIPLVQTRGTTIWARANVSALLLVVQGTHTHTHTLARQITLQLSYLYTRFTFPLFLFFWLANSSTPLVINDVALRSFLENLLGPVPPVSSSQYTTSIPPPQKE